MRVASVTRIRFALIVASVCLLLPGCRTSPATDEGESSAVSPRPVFYPLPPDSPRIEFLTAINSSQDLAPKAENETRSAFARFILGEERVKPPPPSILRQPFGVDAWGGKIYVCDRGEGDVRVFDVLNQKTYSLDEGVGVLDQPTNLCIDPDGYKFIVESMPQRISVFGPDDRYVTSFALKEGRPGDIVAVGRELFVTDVTGGRILVLSRSTGKVTRTFGSHGTKPGQFNMPTAIDADADGNLYVCDTFNYRWQKLDPTGKPLLASGGVGRTYGRFWRPRGISVGPEGVVYVVESILEVVQMFNQEGKALMGFGNFHAAPGYLELPAGIAIDTSCLPYFKKYIDPRFEAEYLVFVVSQAGRSRLGVYAFGRLKPGAAIPVLPALSKPEARATTRPVTATRPTASPQ